MYATEIDGQPLTLCVSGQLWNRSLVMMDTESKSLWSHLLGLCVKGRHKGTRLKTLPSDMLTWSAWKSEFPDTTVLNLKRTSRNYTSRFYDPPEAFVFGFLGGNGMSHVSFAALKHSSVMNLNAGSVAVVATFDSTSTSARLFKRKLGERVLTFASTATTHLKDRQTGSTWDRSGNAIGGELKGQSLKPHVGIVSFKRAWLTFHPRSQELAQD